MPAPSESLLTEAPNPTPIRLLKTNADWQDQFDDDQLQELARQNFSAKPGQHAWVTIDNAPTVVVGCNERAGLHTLGGLPMALTEGDYQLLDPCAELDVLGWALGAYQFIRYKDPKRAPARLVIPDDVDAARLRATADAVGLGRDLINTPAADMAPSHLAAEIEALADEFDAQCTVVRDDALLDLSCGAIHAVGRAADDPPLLIDLTWGNPDHPKITVVGKGVTFDSGGLNIKPSGGMRSMKKDMGGAAAAVALASLIMAQALPVRLRLLIPAAENAIAGNAFRPGDILATHKGLTVEIDNTDAEGRLLLCDALSIGSEDNPELMVDFATLTGSARSAVGTEIAAMFCNDDGVASALYDSGVSTDDPVWRMPLHAAYNHMLDSKVADLVNSAASPYAGSITAALYLQNFVGDTRWVHFDQMAYNTRTRPGRPEGGEAMAMRAVYQYLEQRYGTA
ncbi:MAG: leucyl aminopeptidase family protein [Pseudomonadota bacterium]